MDMGFRDHLYGYGETAGARQAATLALSRALIAVVTIDREVLGHPMHTPWLRIEQEFAVAQALRGAGAMVDVKAIFRARMGAESLSQGHVTIGDLDGRARRWAQMAQRKGAAELRKLVAELAPERGQPDLAALADQISATLAQCATPAWQFERRGRGGRVEVLRPMDDAPFDSADLALAVPFALRRSRVAKSLIPALSGGVRQFVREGLAPLAQVENWAMTLAEQAGEAAARLRLLERYAVAVDVQLAGVRRPAALRRLATQATNRWSVWAAQLARDNGVEVSTAWRTLQQAVDLGLVMPVPTERRSRGDGTLYTIPPMLQLAGLISAPRGRPARATAAPAAIPDLRRALSDLDAAMAAIGRLAGSHEGP